MADKSGVLVLHGPNLNLLGVRQPEVYGSKSLAQLNSEIEELGLELGLEVSIQQANGEGQLIDLIHEAAHTKLGLVFNPAGYTHTSVALHDALLSVAIPTVEVHLSNLYARESMRHNSVTAAACRGVIMGLGISSYLLALRYLATHIQVSR